ncbi:hypothetical protein BDZ91DRAFT_737939 [Kalaharituber pfeilii]|nr:hypothetical protein BDZ91DRAFT_737939 [Kalaharituber pfeilii]
MAEAFPGSIAVDLGGLIFSVGGSRTAATGSSVLVPPWSSTPAPRSLSLLCGAASALLVFIPSVQCFSYYFSGFLQA